MIQQIYPWIGKIYPWIGKIYPQGVNLPPVKNPCSTLCRIQKKKNAPFESAMKSSLIELQAFQISILVMLK